MEGSVERVKREGADKVFSILLVFTTSVGSRVSVAIRVSTSFSCVKAAVASCVLTSSVPSIPSVGEGISVGTGSSVGEDTGALSMSPLLTCWEEICASGTSGTGASGGSGAFKSSMLGVGISVGTGISGEWMGMESERNVLRGSSGAGTSVSGTTLGSSPSACTEVGDCCISVGTGSSVGDDMAMPESDRTALEARALCTSWPCS